MTEEQKQRLEQQLWNIANELRGKMDADEFRDYILGFIFFKYLSEKQYIYANKLLETESVKNYAKLTDEEDIAAIKEESLHKLGYFLRPNELFSAITKRGNADVEGESNFILEDLQAILNSIEQSTMGTESEDDFNKLFEDLDLGSTKLGRSVEARNTLIAKVLSHLNKIDFALDKIDSDVLGDAYEYLIAQFASGAGKKAGEFYTPQQVSKILAKIVTLDKPRIKSAYDPTCGSGSLLLRIAKEAEVGAFYGQELNRTTYNLCRMNMILHDVHFSRFDIKQEDTLEDPQHLDMRFEAVVANPPFSAKWKGADNPLNETDDRFSQYGRLAPGTKADFAFIQHMIFQMADHGVAAVVVPHGVLYRGGAEGVIREYIVREQNYLDAVIGLPSNIFYGTSIPACILVFKKCRQHDGDILFIDSSQEYEKSGNKNILKDRHVERIMLAYENRDDIERYSKVVSLAEVAKNEYNLNIPRYVENFDDENVVNVTSVSNELTTIDVKLAQIDAEINAFITKLNSDGMNKKDGSPYPDWEYKKFGQIYEFKSTNSLSRENLNYVEGEVKNIHYGDIHTKFNVHFDVELENVPYLNGDIQIDKIAADKFCEEGDLVIADASEDYNDIGKTIEIVALHGQKVVAGLHTLLARRINSDYIVGFGAFMMASASVRRQVQKIAQGIKVLSISPGRMSEIIVPVPSKDEQRVIIQALSAVDRKAKLLERKAALMTSLRMESCKTFLDKI